MAKSLTSGWNFLLKLTFLESSGSKFIMKFWFQAILSTLIFCYFLALFNFENRLIRSKNQSAQNGLKWKSYYNYGPQGTQKYQHQWNISTIQGLYLVNYLYFSQLKIVSLKFGNLLNKVPGLLTYLVKVGIFEFLRVHNYNKISISSHFEHFDFLPFLSAFEKL